MQEHNTHTETHANCRIEIFRDDDADSPDGWENDVFLVANHRDFTVRREGWTVNAETIERHTAPDEPRPRRWDAQYREDFAERPSWEFANKLGYADDCLRERQAAWDERVANAKRWFLAPLEAYIHSGVRLALVCEHREFPDRRWDVSRLGYVVVDRKALGEAGEPADDAGCLEVAKELVEDWNTYLEGRVFGYSVKHVFSGEEESCGGFYDSDWDGRTNCLPEAREVAESLDAQWRKHLAEEQAADNLPGPVPHGGGDVDSE